MVSNFKLGSIEVKFKNYDTLGVQRSALENSSGAIARFASLEFDYEGFSKMIITLYKAD